MLFWLAAQLPQLLQDPITIGLRTTIHLATCLLTLRASCNLPLFWEEPAYLTLSATPAYSDNIIEAIVFDGYNYGTLPLSFIPGLLVAVPRASTTSETVELVFIEQLITDTGSPSLSTIAIDVIILVGVFYLVRYSIFQFFRRFYTSEEGIEEEDDVLDERQSHSLLSSSYATVLRICIPRYAASISPASLEQLIYLNTYEDIISKRDAAAVKVLRGCKVQLFTARCKLERSIESNGFTRTKLNNATTELKETRKEKRDADEKYNAQIKEEHAKSLDLKQKCDKAEEAVVHFKAAVNGLKTERDNLQADIVAHDGQLEGATQKRVVLERQIRDMQSKETQRAAQHAQEMTQLNATIQTLSTSFDTLSKAYNSLAASHATAIASTKVIKSKTKEIHEGFVTTGNVMIDIHNKVTTLRNGERNMKLALQFTDKLRAEFASTLTVIKEESAARVNALQIENAAVTSDNKSLKEVNMSQWKNAAGLRYDNHDLRVLLAKAKLEIKRLEAAAPSALPPITENSSPLVESDSTTSLMAFSLPSSDDLLALQLPTSTSFASIDGFDPLDNEDPFDSDPMLAMPTFRFTVSAPPSPTRKLVATRQADWNALQPSTSVPVDLSLL